MGYHHIDPDDIEPLPDRPSEARSISNAADLSNVGVRRYRVEPGEQMPLKYHGHEEQEEVFYVLSGAISFETPEETYRVESDEAFVVKPDHPHRGHVPEDADEAAVVLALGAPDVLDAFRYDANE